MSAEKLTLETDPAREDVDFLDRQINAYNFETTGVRDGSPLAYFLRGCGGEILAGLSGYIWGDCCDIRYLWVRADLRRNGHGTQLMQAAEDEAARRGCRQVVLDTHSFQAPEFYRKRGYEVVGVFEGYPGDHKKFFLRKRLVPAQERVKGGGNQ